MFQLEKEGQIEIIEKKSRFITRMFFVHDEIQVKKYLKTIIEKEKGAVHNCYAYRIINNDQSLIERKSDDGEPGGTAGAPMLAVLTNENLINILVITSRYFGGIKLGTGGLVRVYRRGVNEIIKECGKNKYEPITTIKISFAINETNHAEYLFNKENIVIREKRFNTTVEFVLNSTDSKKSKIDEIIKQINGKILND